ncbi:MAG: LysE family translocator [Acidocella sp.]|nr:LysE family translocator [Acidocella sp.]
MTIAQSLISFILAAGLLTITPGLDTALVLRTAMAEGPASAIKAALGVICGCLAWGAGVAVGLGVLLTAAPLAYQAVKWAGVSYLFWLGLQLLRRPRTALTTQAEAAAPGSANWFRKGMLQNLLNPKVGVFYISFLPQFIPAAVSPGYYTFFLAVIHGTLDVLWFGALILATQPLARLLQKPASIRLIDRFTGCAFIAFGTKLALARR